MELDERLPPTDDPPDDPPRGTAVPVRGPLDGRCGGGVRMGGGEYVSPPEREDPELEDEPPDDPPDDPEEPDPPPDEPEPRGTA